ncbi:MAG TPA: hypothetical protein VGT40_05530 [Methylomirabilota bacterium]|nr:hypothetical protein [Methylomirabilota bacterium]
MARRLVRVALLLVLLGPLPVAGPSRMAWAQGELFVANRTNDSVTVYARVAGGNTAPVRMIAGTATALAGPIGLAVDLAHNELFVTNEGDSVVRIYALNASGNAAPLRSLGGPLTGLSGPVAVAVDTVNDELVVTNGGSIYSISVFARTASGNTPPLRTITGGATGLALPDGVAVDRIHNELVVANFFANSITVFGRTASGNVPPLRTIAGPTTGMAEPNGLALDLVHDEIAVSNLVTNSVTVFARTAIGNMAPLRTLVGGLTGINGPVGVVLDTLNDELLVANNFTPSVTVYSRTASGNTAPLRTLSGEATKLSGPEVLAVTTGCGPTAVFPASAAVHDVTAGREVVGPVPLAAAVLPSSRSVQVGCPATAFVTIINAGTSTATAVGIAKATGVPADFTYQITNPLTNVVTGNPNTPVDIEAGKSQTYVIALTPTAGFPPTDVAFSFAGSNTAPLATLTGINTLLLSGSVGSVPDIVVLAATLDNDGIVNLAGVNGSGAFSVATVNVGASATITATADTGGASLPVTISLCQTNPATGQCISAIGASVTAQISGGATPTFSVFVTGSGAVPFDPAANRVFVRFKDESAATRGSTSVAVRTQ